MMLRRRALLACSLAAPALLTRRASAAGNVTAAIYPGPWEEAYRAIVAPALKSDAGAMTPARLSAPSRSEALQPVALNPPSSNTLQSIEAMPA